MNKAEARFAYLFDSYFKKTATQQETNELFHLIEHTADNEHLTMLMKKAWDEIQVTGSVLEADKSYEILNNILCVDAQKIDIDIDETPVRSLSWRRYAAAAAIFLLVGTGVYFGLIVEEPTQQEVAKLHPKVLQDAMPGTNKAVLTLADGSQVPLDSAHVGDLSKQGRSLVKNVNGKLIYTVANTEEEAIPKINMLSTPRGGQYQIVLPDGSKVWLNATSSIKYPTFFKGKERRVEITGEVYFEVAKNAAMPFIVKSNLTEIEVLGTHFNVMAYDDEDAMKTTLEEGAVRIRSGKWSGILKPGQQALLRKQDGANFIKEVDLDHELAWKNGLFQFADDDIQTIMRKVSRWYDLDIVYQGKIPVKQYIGTISRNVKVSDVLNMLKYTGVNTEIKGKNIYLLD
jgi:transmembrane sensor